MTKAVNCNACGNEFRDNELKTIHLSKLGTMAICINCHSKTAGQNYKDASDILIDIQKIAKAKKDPEERLKMIKKMLGE